MPTFRYSRFAIGLVALLVVTLLTMEERTWHLLKNSFWLACGTCLIALPIGTLLALGIAKTDVPGRRLAQFLLTALIFVPLYLVAAAWEAGFGMQGWATLAFDSRLTNTPWLEGWRGAIWVHGMAAVPWVVFLLSSSFHAQAELEADLEEGALLVMPAYQVLLRVTLRRSGMALFLAGAWVAILTSIEIAVTDLFQIRTFAEEVYTRAAMGDLSEMYSGASLLPMIALLAVLALLMGRSFVIRMPQNSPRRPWVWKLKRMRWPAAIGLWFTLFLMVGVPLGNLLTKAGVRVTVSESGRHRDWSAAKAIERLVQAPGEHRRELWQTAKISTLAATTAWMLGAALAWSMRRIRRTPWARLSLLAFCLTVPGPVLGLGVIRWLNRPVDSPFAWLTWLYDDTIFAPWFVQTVRALPIVTLLLWPALASIPQAVLDAARTDGAGRWMRWVHIILPMRWPALLAAWLCALAVAMGELAATVLVIPPGTTTISVRIFSLLHYGVEDRVASICLVMAFGLALLPAIAAQLFAKTASEDRL